MFVWSFMLVRHWICWVSGDTIIYKRTPNNTLTSCYSQDVGRAGRDGEHAFCYTIPCKITTFQQNSFSKQDDLKGQMAMADWLRATRQCLRFGLTKFIDGVGRQCTENPNARRCSWCKGHDDLVIQSSSSSHKAPNMPKDTTSMVVLGKRPAHKVANSFTEAFASSKRRREDRSAGQDGYINQFKSALSKFKGICAFCRVYGYIKSYHSILKCQTMLLDPTLKTNADTYRSWKTCLRYNEQQHGNICYFCHVPQCHDLLHDTFQSAAGSCQHPDVVAGVAYGVFHHQELRCKAEESFCQQWSCEDQFVQWLNKAPVAGHRTNITALFLWYSNTI